MHTVLRSALTTLAVAATALTLLSPMQAAAREGSSSSISVGKGIKCRWVSTLNADGSVSRNYVCGKFGV